jgi:hypothetical protein
VLYSGYEQHLIYYRTSSGDTTIQHETYTSGLSPNRSIDTINRTVFAACEIS